MRCDAMGCGESVLHGATLGLCGEAGCGGSWQSDGRAGDESFYTCCLSFERHMSTECMERTQMLMVCEAWGHSVYAEAMTQYDGDPHGLSIRLPT
jgi:hypothetical protein